MYQGQPVSIRQYISAQCAAIQLIQEGMQIIHGHRKCSNLYAGTGVILYDLWAQTAGAGEQDIIIQVFQ